MYEERWRASMRAPFTFSRARRVHFFLFIYIHAHGGVGYRARCRLSCLLENMYISHCSETLLEFLYFAQYKVTFLYLRRPGTYGHQSYTGIS